MKTKSIIHWFVQNMQLHANAIRYSSLDLLTYWEIARPDVHCKMLRNQNIQRPNRIDSVFFCLFVFQLYFNRRIHATDSVSHYHDVQRAYTKAISMCTSIRCNLIKSNAFEMFFDRLFHSYFIESNENQCIAEEEKKATRNKEKIRPIIWNTGRREL